MSEPRVLRLRVVASKEDNPWLPEDLVSRPGVAGCNLSGTPLPKPDLERDAIQNVTNGARAVIHRLREEGLL